MSLEKLSRLAFSIETQGTDTGDAGSKIEAVILRANSTKKVLKGR